MCATRTSDTSQVGRYLSDDFFGGLPLPHSATKQLPYYTCIAHRCQKQVGGGGGPSPTFCNTVGVVGFVPSSHHCMPVQYSCRRSGTCAFMWHGLIEPNKTHLMQAMLEVRLGFSHASLMMTNLFFCRSLPLFHDTHCKLWLAFGHPFLDFN